MGWNYPNPIYCYPKRKQRDQCNKCEYKQEIYCTQKTDCELEGYTERKCKYFKEK